MNGVSCPLCHGFAIREPGAIWCYAGHSFTMAKILPRDHVSGRPGRDYENRVRQQALDQAFMHPARAPEFVFAMLQGLRL